MTSVGFPGGVGMLGETSHPAVRPLHAIEASQYHGVACGYCLLFAVRWVGQFDALHVFFKFCIDILSCPLVV